MASTQMLIELGDNYRPAYRVLVNDGFDTTVEFFISGTAVFPADRMQDAVRAFADALAVSPATVRSIAAIAAAETPVELAPQL
jgi:hypothetical protein